MTMLLAIFLQERSGYQHHCNSLNRFHYKYVLKGALHIVHLFSEGTKWQIISDVWWRSVSQHNLLHIKALTSNINILLLLLLILFYFLFLNAGQEHHIFATQIIAK